jgi:hypothetical protein
LGAGGREFESRRPDGWKPLEQADRVDYSMCRSTVGVPVGRTEDAPTCHHTGADKITNTEDGSKASCGDEWHDHAGR